MSASALVVVSTSPAYAETPAELLEIVRQQAAEIAALKARMDEIERPAPALASSSAQAANPVPAVAVTPPSPALEPTTSVSFKGAPQLANADGTFTFKSRGRIQVDSWGVNSRTDDIDYASGTEVRRGRLGAEGRIFGDFGYMFEVDFAGEVISFQDVYLNYALNKSTTLTAGYHKSPITLEDQTSDNYITFIERALYASTFAPGRGTGLSATWAHTRGMLMAGVWGEGENDSRDGTVDEDWVAAGRATYLPWKTTNGMLHLGASAYYLAAGNDTPRFRLRERPENHLATRLVDSGPLTIDDARFAGLEAVLIQGPVHVTGEWGSQWVNRSGAPTARFDGGYAQVGWFLTGEKRPYSVSSASFGRLQPKRNLTDGGIGAFELAARYSVLDLEDTNAQAAVLGGVEKNWTLGLNWYANPYMRVMVNFVRFNIDRSFATKPLGSPRHKGDAFGMRAQIDW